MAYFPMFADLQDQPVLIIGGGRVALHKVKRLQPYEPSITVVSEHVSEELKETGVLWEERSLSLEECDDYMMVIAATDNPDFNHQISAYCRERRILCNVVDDQKWCSFIFPSLVKKGKMTIGISSSGASPAAAVYMKKKVEELIPEQMPEILECLESLRPEVKKRINTEKKRSVLFSRLFAMSMEKNRALTKEEAEEEIRKEENNHD